MLFTALREQDDGGVLVLLWVVRTEDNKAEPYAKADAFEDKGGTWTKCLRSKIWPICLARDLLWPVDLTQPIISVLERQSILL